MAATLQAEGQGYVATATALGDLAAIQQTRVMATANAASTRVVEVQRMNQQLLATVRAGDSFRPRPGVATVATVEVNAGGEDAQGAQYLVTGTASRVRESDGCIDTAQTQFMLDIPRIYATLRALNVRSGTRMEAVWNYEGAEVLRDSWTVPQDETDFCIWFFIDPSLVQFKAGNWSVQFYADGLTVGETSTFQMNES